MLNISLVYECEHTETYHIQINNRVFEIQIENASDGPVFTFFDEYVELQPHERMNIIKELEGLINKFVSRRIFGSYRPTLKSQRGFTKLRKNIRQ